MSPQLNILGVIFDMDGVLTDSEPIINAAAITMFRELGLAVQPEDFRPFIGTGEDRYIGGVAEAYGFAIELPTAKRRTYEIYLEMVSTRLKAFPGAQTLVYACRKAGMRLAVASSADRIKVEANLAKIGLPIAEWDAVVTGEDVLAKKPAPDIFLKAAEKLRLLPPQCTVIEDALNGIEAALAAGMRCVAVAQSFPRERLQRAHLVRQRIADVSVSDLRASPPS
jgi:HAD superfamily hydrolase (TIGR01509 family)